MIIQNIRMWFAFLIVALNFAWFEGECNAGIIVAAENKTERESSAVIRTEVEIYLDLTAADDGGSISIGNFQVGLELLGANAGTDVSIVGITGATSTSHPLGRALDFAVATPTRAFGMTLNFFGPSFLLNDLDGLMRVELEIQPNVTGTYQLNVLTGERNTAMAESIFSRVPLSIATQSSTLNIQSSVVPEPIALPYFCFIGIIGFCQVRRVRSKNSNDQPGR